MPVLLDRFRGTDPQRGCQVSVAFDRLGSGHRAPWIARITFAYAVAILLLSSADFSFEWRARVGGSTQTTRGVGLSVGYFGVWEVPTEPAGLRARLHTSDFGFAGATLVARGTDSRVLLVAPWAGLAVAWFVHLAWALMRRRRA
jgi:hypothetical protein